MQFDLFSRVALRQDLSDYNLRQGDVATVVEHHPVSNGEDGYSLEVFNALGDTIAVVVVAASQIERLQKNAVLHIRRLDEAV